MSVLVEKQKIKSLPLAYIHTRSNLNKCLYERSGREGNGNLDK